MRNRRLLKSEHPNVLNMFEMGLSQRRIADSMGVPVGAVRRVIRDKYPEFEGRRHLPVKELLSKYKDGLSVSELADHYGVAIATIQSRLRDNNVELRPMGEERRKHFFNDHFFEVIDSEQKAYWLGFIFADGNVSARMKDVSIALSRKDRGHLEKFLVDIDYDGPGGIMDIDGQGFGVPVEYSKVSLRSQQMAADLVDKGCLPNKSLDCSGPSNLPVEHTMHFIRGVVDGDGYVSGGGLSSLEVVGAHDLMAWVADELDATPPRPHKNIWRVRLSGSRAEKAMETLYRGCSVALDRKADRARKNYDK